MFLRGSLRLLKCFFEIRDVRLASGNFILRRIRELCGSIRRCGCSVWHGRGGFSMPIVEVVGLIISPCNNMNRTTFRQAACVCCVILLGMDLTGRANVATFI